VIGADLPQQVFLACGVTDMRKSIDGLAALVQHRYKLDPFSSALFVFCSRSQDRIKILRWDHNGFWLYYRRLEKGKFHWPSNPSDGTLHIGRRELNWLLDGLSVQQRQAHPEVRATVVG